MVTQLAERILRRIAHRMGIIELIEPVIVQDVCGSWLRIAPNESPRWFFSEREAREYRAA